MRPRLPCRSPNLLKQLPLLSGRRIPIPQTSPRFFGAVCGSLSACGISSLRASVAAACRSTGAPSTTPTMWPVAWAPVRATFWGTPLGIYDSSSDLRRSPEGSPGPAVASAARRASDALRARRRRVRRRSRSARCRGRRRATGRLSYRNVANTIPDYVPSSAPARTRWPVVVGRSLKRAHRRSIQPRGRPAA